MGPGRDRTRDPWICSQLRICSQTRYRLRYAARSIYVVKSFILSKKKLIKSAYSVNMNIFEKKYFLFKSFVKVELSYVFTIKMFSTAENCMAKMNYLTK